MSYVPGIVAINTFREAVRDLVGQISIGIERLVIVNLGLTAIAIFGLVMSIFIGVGLVYKEIEKRTLYTLLAKPIRRWQFLVGKYWGLLLTLVVNTFFMTLGLAAALFYVSRPFVRGDGVILVAIYFILLQLALVTALALFFSCFSSPMLSTLFTLGIYITGVFIGDIRNVAEFTRNQAVIHGTRFLYYIVPNFHNFNVIATAAHGETIPFSLFWQNTLYAVLYVTLVLIASSAVFSYRDLK
jgi:ABC-type transport system involved in multi-copper enzyme maturation permease subunit